MAHAMPHARTCPSEHHCDRLVGKHWVRGPEHIGRCRRGRGRGRGCQAVKRAQRGGNDRACDEQHGPRAGEEHRVVTNAQFRNVETAPSTVCTIHKLLFTQAVSESGTHTLRSPGVALDQQ
jgi:hypothetical protein